MGLKLIGNAVDVETGDSTISADDELRVIRYVIVDTWNSMLGKKIIMLPVWVERVAWF
jgi:hypothetical protein